MAHELALQKTLAELKLLAKEKFDQVPYFLVPSSRYSLAEPIHACLDSHMSPQIVFFDIFVRILSQINMDKEKEGGLTAEEASQLDQQILALENSLKVPGRRIILYIGSTPNRASSPLILFTP